MPDNAPWINGYECKNWKLYEVLMGSSEMESLCSSLGDSGFFVCAAESEAARKWWTDHKSIDGLLFYDIEQLWAWGLYCIYGVHLEGILTKEWNGHPKESLVLSVFKGVTKSPPFCTVGVVH